jgi:hypothetical protein
MVVARRNGKDENSFERQQAWGLTKKIQHPSSLSLFLFSFYHHKDIVLGSILPVVPFLWTT